MVELLSTNPAKLFGLYPRKGTVAVGSDADLVVFDPEKRHLITAAGQQSKTDYNLYEGTEVVGDIETVLLRGNVIVEGGEVVGKPGIGQFVPPGTLRREARRGSRRGRRVTRLGLIGTVAAAVVAPRRSRTGSVATTSPRRRASDGGGRGATAARPARPAWRPDDCRTTAARSGDAVRRHRRRLVSLERRPDGRRTAQA